MEKRSEDDASTIVISLLYLLFWLPSQVFGLMNIFYTVLLPQFQADFVDYFVVFVHLLFPFMCLLSYPEMLKQIRCQRKWRAIRPVRIAVAEVNQLQIEMGVYRQNIRNSPN